MNLEGSVALVTGANRRIGNDFVEASLLSGVAKVYTGERHPSTHIDPRVTSVELDVTSPHMIATIAQTCTDVALLINKAGIMQWSPVLAPDAEKTLLTQFDVNVLGMLRMITAFAPILKTNGGGVIVNMLSVLSWFATPANATYCASKHAALAISDSARIELHAENTNVIGVYAGFVDTDMANNVDEPKVSPMDVASAALACRRVRRTFAWETARRPRGHSAARMPKHSSVRFKLHGTHAGKFGPGRPPH